MFQSNALWGLLLVTLAISIVKAEIIIDDDIQAVIIQAPAEKDNEQSNRKGRHMLLAYPSPFIRVGAFYPGLRTPCTTTEGLDGTCMSINNCHPTWKIFRTEGSASWAFGRDNICAYNVAGSEQVFGVCCPNSNSTTASESPSGGSTEAASSDEEDKKKGASRATACLLTNNQKQRIQSSQCTRNNFKRDAVDASNNFISKVTSWPGFGGLEVPAKNYVSSIWRYKRAVDTNIHFGQKIVGGYPINPHQFKFVAALLTQSGSTARQFCGGSLIDEYHILTAAHCVARYTESDVKRLVVHLGAHDISSNSGKSKHKVTRIIRHIDFSDRTLDNDVAILTLASPAPIGSNPNVKQVCLPSRDELFENREAIVAGWGSLRFGGSQPSLLHMVTVKIWKNSVCGGNYGSNAPGGITSRMMCASLPGKDSCQGDSGGALFTCTSDDDCSQIGIVSWGIGCADATYPGVYTRVTKLADWIQRITSCY